MYSTGRIAGDQVDACSDSQLHRALVAISRLKLFCYRVAAASDWLALTFKLGSGARCCPFVFRVATASRVSIRALKVEILITSPAG